MEQNESLFVLALNRVSFLKPREKMLLLEICGSASRIFALSLNDLEGYLGRRIKSRQWLKAEYLKMAEADRKYLTERVFKCIFYSSEKYPPQLREIYDPPLVLFYRGKLPDYSKPLVAVVGTRRPAGVARSKAYSLGFDLAEMGIGTVSGLARGIDIEAHRGTLAADGMTVAVLGNGIDMIFPKTSSGVGREILKQGGVIFSEYPPGTLPYPYNFPARNRIISGLARTVVVVQAPERSGALITADYALEQGRDLFVHSVGLTGVVGMGSRKLHADGAKAINAAGDILEEWGWDPGGGGRPHHAEVLQGRHNGKAGPGRQLARLMEYEILKKIARNNGELYLRKSS